MDQGLFRSLWREQGPSSLACYYLPCGGSHGDEGGGHHRGAQEHGQALPGHAMCCGRRPRFIDSQKHTFPAFQRLGNWDVSSVASRSQEIG